MNELRSYPKVYNLGHRAIRDLFFGDVGFDTFAAYRDPPMESPTDVPA